MKKTLSILLLALLLFASCRKGGESIGIWSDEGVLVYSNKGENSKIVVSSELFAELSKDIGMEEAISYLFPDTLMFPLKGGEWRQREIVTSSFVSFMGTETIEEAYGRERKSIEKSDYLENMGDISKGFEKELLDMVKKSGDQYREYSVDKVVGKEGGEEEKRLFLKKWIKAIVG